MLAFEVLDSKIANRLRTGSYWNLQKKQVATEAGTAQTQRRFLIVCQIAWVMYKNFRINGEREAILDFGDLMKVMLTNDNLQFLDT